MSAERHQQIASLTDRVNAQLNIPGGVFYLSSDLEGFNTWRAEVQKLPEGREKLRKVLAGTRKVLAPLLTKDTGESYVLSDEGIHDIVRVMAYFSDGISQEERGLPLEVIAQFAQGMRDDPQSPQKRLEHYGVQANTNPLIIATYHSDSTEHAAKISQHSLLLGSPLPIPSLEGPAVKRLVDIETFAQEANGTLEGRILMDASSIKAMVKARTGKDASYSEITEELQKVGLRINRTHNAGKGDDRFTLYELSPAEADEFAKRSRAFARIDTLYKDRVRAAPGERISRYEMELNKVVMGTFGEKKSIRRRFFGTDFVFDKRSYKRFLHELVSRANDFYTKSQSPPEVISLSRKGVNQLLGNIQELFINQYIKEGFPRDAAKDKAADDAKQALRRLPIRNAPAGSSAGPHLYDLTPADQTLMGSIGRDIYIATAMLALTPMGHAPENQTLSDWTSGVMSNRWNDIGGTSVTSYLSNADDSVDLEHYHQIHKSDMFEAIIQDALVETQNYMNRKNRKGIFLDEQQFAYFKSHVQAGYVLERALAHEVETMDTRLSGIMPLSTLPGRKLP